MSMTLYPGIPFSPQATLTNNIGAADTIIQVSDISAFPDAPNLATIGTDEEGETILYTAKTDAALSGCQRGVEGAAKAWAAGELIGRNFTAKDHADLIAAVKEAAKTAEADGVAFQDGQTFQEKYDAGQLMGRDGAPGSDGADGKSAYQYAVDGGYTGTEEEFQALLGDALSAVSGFSNPNLLDNWYFPDPINQRGQTEYTASGYTIDRWRILSNIYMVLVDEGLQLTGQNNYGRVRYVEEILRDVRGRTVTFSALIDHELYSLTATIPTSGDFTFSEVAEFGQLNIYHDISATKALGVQFRITGGKTIIAKAAKLELGPVQTLAHQDENGNWVLNDPPPDKGLELLKCQRYFQVFSEESLRPAKAVDFRPVMRIDPALSTIEIDGTTYYAADANL